MSEAIFSCVICKTESRSSFSEIRHHEYSCRLAQNNKSRQKRNATAVVCNKPSKKLTLISSYIESVHYNERNVQIGEEIFPLLNDASSASFETSLVPNYVDSQMFMFEVSFSKEHFYCNTWHEFTNLPINSINIDLYADLKFYSDQLATGNVSERAGKAAIARILRHEPSIPPPNNWITTKRRVENLLQNFKKLIYTVPFPSEWNIPDDIPRVTIEVRDILDIIATVMADPKLQSSGEFHLRGFKIEEDVTGKKSRRKIIGCDHIMSSFWALKAQEKIDKVNPDKESFLIPIILYEDGVTVDSAMTKSVDNIVLTLGNYSKKLRMVDYSKHHVGFVPKIQKSAKILNSLQLMYGKTRGSEIWKLFKFKLRREIYRLILSPLKSVPLTGNYDCKFFLKVIETVI